MKKLIASLLLAAAVIASIVGTTGLTGCATTGSGTNSVPTLTPQQLTNTAILVKGTTASALLLVVQKNTNAIPYICASADALSLFVSGGDLTPAKLQADLQKLPIKGISKPEAGLVISTVVTAYQLYFADYVQNKVGGNQIASVLLSAIRDGASTACTYSGP